MLVVVHWDLNIVVQIKLDILLLDILWLMQHAELLSCGYVTIRC